METISLLWKERGNVKEDKVKGLFESRKTRVRIRMKTDRTANAK